MLNKKVGIVSLGLIGGSLLKVLSGKVAELCAVTRNSKTLIDAEKYTKNLASDYSLLKECDIVFVCSPMSETIRILDELELILPETAIVADVCSLKEFVMTKKRPYIFIGSHPMAGTENSGFDSSFAELFKGARWVLTPDNVPQKYIDDVVSVIGLTGAKTLFMSAEEHDKTVALISHMPMILAQSLMKAAMKDEKSIKLASSGFRDMTRLAMSNTKMANDMLSLNKDNILRSFDLMVDCFKELTADDYVSEIEEINLYRRKMFDTDGKNISN